jgi:ABC-type uncharacterized transport system permease subunit
MLLQIGAILSLGPAALLLLRRHPRRDALVWCALALAVAGPTALVAVQNASGWLPSLSGSLWVSVTAAMILFAVVAARNDTAWRLLPLLAAYAVAMGVAGAAFAALPIERLPPANSVAWLDLHILVSVATYGLATIAAVAGIAVLLQERSLKRRRTHHRFLLGLPAVAEGERLFTWLLAAAEVVLGVGVLSGMATQYLMSGRLLVLNHKTLFSLLAFLIIALLLWLSWRTGLRGRRATRFVLAAYLLLTLAYPGVKFVRDVLLS